MLFISVRHSGCGCGCGWETGLCIGYCCSCCCCGLRRRSWRKKPVCSLTFKRLHKQHWSCLASSKNNKRNQSRSHHIKLPMLIFMASSGSVVVVVVTVAVCPLATVFCSFSNWFFFVFNSGNHSTCIIAGSINLRFAVACC